MSRRWIMGASALACLAAGAALAQQAPTPGTPKRGGALQVVVTPEPPMLMQGLNQNGPTNMISGNIYESLLRYDETLKPMPSLAKSWDISADQTVYTFKLQEGVVWHDGKPFTADDVVFTLDKFLRETHPRWRLIANAQVKAIEKVDDLAVRITLKQPFGPFMLSQEVSSAPMIPKHIYDGAGDYRANPMNATPIGTGPMKFKEWRRGSYIQLVRNEQYWDKPKPYLDEIYFQFIPDAAARATAFESGRVDVLTGGSVEIFDVARLSKLPNTCVTNKGWEMFAPHAWITPNVKNGILGNKQFRQAMMYAIDREFGRDVVWSGYGKIATGPISSKTKFYSADVPRYAYDPKKARELVKASGYKGEAIRFLGLPYGEIWSRWAEAIKQNFEEVGIKLEIVSTDVPGWTQKTSNSDFDLTFNFLYQLGDPATGVSRSYVSSNIVKGNPFANVGQYSNPEVDRLFAEAANAPDEQRQALYTKVQRILVDEVPLLWLLELDFPTVSRCTVKDLVTSAVGINDAAKNVWKQ